LFLLTGKTLGKIETKTSVRTCNFSYGGNMALYSTDSQMGHPSEIFIIDVRMVSMSDNFGSADPILQIPLTNAPKATSMVWGNLDQIVISGHDNGDLAQWDLRYCQFIFNIPLNSVKLIFLFPAQDWKKDQSRIRARQSHQRHASFQGWRLFDHCIQGLHSKAV